MVAVDLGSSSLLRLYWGGRCGRSRSGKYILAEMDVVKCVWGPMAFWPTHHYQLWLDGYTPIAPEAWLLPHLKLHCHTPELPETSLPHTCSLIFTHAGPAPKIQFAYLQRPGTKADSLSLASCMRTRHLAKITFKHFERVSLSWKHILFGKETHHLSLTPLRNSSALHTAYSFITLLRL